VEACTGSNLKNFKKKGRSDPMMTEKKTIADNETVIASDSLLDVCEEKWILAIPTALSNAHIATPIIHSLSSILYFVSSLISPRAIPRMIRTAA
jgi:hypothetical protein